MSYLIATLNFALSRKRPHKGKGEAELRSFVRRTIGGASTIDDTGNLIIDRRQRNDGGTSRTLFVAHMDTVHRVDGRNTFVQDRKNKLLKAAGDPLGADDGAGVAMLVHLLKHGVPGLYVFTVGEEVGGVGASAFAQTNHKLLANEIDRAIAFDRRGGTSVITHQSRGKCASDEFAEALSAKLNDANDALLYMPDDTGVYTDTAEFTHLVPECTNISVGYDHEHSAHETLDLAHFEALAAGVLTFDWDTLPTTRKPGDMGMEQRFSWDLSKYMLADVDEAPCARDDRFRLYDALDGVDFGWRGPHALMELLVDELRPLCKTRTEKTELELLIRNTDITTHMIDLMYEAAEHAPGYEINAAAHAFANSTGLWDAVESCVKDTRSTKKGRTKLKPTLQ